MNLRDRLGRLTAWERVGWCAAACCLVGAVSFRPALRAVRPDVAVSVSGLEDCYEWLAPRAKPFVDPWGTSEIFESGNPPPFTTWRSAGPDRIHGTGDDIDVVAASTALGLWDPGPLPVWVPFVLRGPELLSLAAITLVWCLIAPFRRSPRAAVGREFARAALLASVPAAIGALALDWYLRTTSWHELDRQDVLLVPWRVAACGSVVLLCGLVALAWRLRAATPAGSTTTSPESPSAPPPP